MLDNAEKSGKSLKFPLPVNHYWWMDEFKCERWFQCATIGADERHCADISVTITLERGGNTADQEAE
jgi:hypothetical protein